MIPNFSVRIDNIIKSMELVIVPSLKDEAGLANEQSSLIVKLLNLMKNEWNHLLVFERQALTDMIQAVTCVVDKVSGGERTQSTARLIATRLNDATLGADTLIRPEDANLHYCALGDALEQHIEAVYVDADPHYKSQLVSAVIKFGQQQSFRERVWFQATEMEPDKNELPAFKTIF